MHIKEVGVAEWERALPNTGYELFHTVDALNVLETHWPGELCLFAGYKGQEPVGLLPLFIRHNRVGRIVSSPPVGFGVGRLGPIVMSTSPKQRKCETINKKFVRKVIETIDATDQFTLFRVIGNTKYNDPRPFKWDGFDATPAFTYQLHIESKTLDQLLGSFSRDLRKDIRKRDDVPITVRRGENGDAQKVYEAMVNRYQKQGKDQPVSWDFVEDLLHSLGRRARVYVAESNDGEFLSGMIILYADDTAYNWKGGAKPSSLDTSVSVNNLLHWKIIEDIVEDPDLESITAYDFYTANNERLSRYKSSFNGSLVPYYTIESNSVPMAIAKMAYRKAMSNNIPHGKQLFIEPVLKGK